MQAAAAASKQQKKNTKSPVGGADLTSLMDAIPPGTPDATDLPAITLQAGNDDAEAFEQQDPASPVFTIHATQEVPVPLHEAKAVPPIAEPPGPVRSKSMASGLRAKPKAPAQVNVPSTPTAAEPLSEAQLLALFKVDYHIAPGLM